MSEDKTEVKEKTTRPKENKVFMHTCCAPCSVYCIDLLKSEGIEPVIFWYNPNIHPYTEYKLRRECLRDYAKKMSLEMIEDNEYSLEEFVKRASKDLDNRCKKVCYTMRLERAAKTASKLGFSKYTTTLMVSPYQDTESLIRIGQEMGRKYGVEFLVRDFKKGFREGQEKARSLGMYMQKYCGCIFSEADRYMKNKWRIKKMS